MKIARFELIGGAAGDMIIGALLDSGLDFNRLKTELEKLPLDGYQISVEKTARHQISSTRFIVEIKGQEKHRHLKDINKIIDDSLLAENIKSKCKRIFRRLVEAEAAVHGAPVESVHLHEVGMTDAIVDICGAVIGLDLFGVERVFCSTLVVGSGITDSQHGKIPLPAPATIELIKGFPIIQTGIDGELLTPTGAAVLTSLCSFENPGSYEIKSIGYGSGSRELKERPNLLRVTIAESQADLDNETIVQLETNLDRVTSEQIGFLMERLFESGALDVFITPIQMKKNRPAHLLSVLCPAEDETRLTGIIFTSGVTLGIRRRIVERTILPRQEIKIDTNYGPMPVKLAKYQGKTLYFPEYDMVAAAAKKTGKGFEEIYFEILSQLGKER